MGGRLKLIQDLQKSSDKLKTIAKRLEIVHKRKSKAKTKKKKTRR